MNPDNFGRIKSKSFRNTDLLNYNFGLSYLNNFLGFHSKPDRHQQHADPW